MKTVQCPSCTKPLTEDNPGIPTQTRIRRATKYKWHGRNAWVTKSMVCKNCADKRNVLNEADWENSLVMPSMPIFFDGAEPAQCEGCNAPLLLKIDKRRKHVYCSKSCRNRIHIKSVEPTATVCALCKTLFSSYSGGHPRRFYTRACAYRALKERRRLKAKRDRVARAGFYPGLVVRLDARIAELGG